MLTMAAQGLSVSPAVAAVVGCLLGFSLLGTIAHRSGARRRRLWLRFANALFWIIVVSGTLIFLIEELTGMSAEGWACLITLAVIPGAYLRLTKSGRSVLRSENRHAGRPTPVPHARGRLTIYVVVTTLAVLVAALPLSFVLVELLKHHAPGWNEVLDMPIFLGVFLVLMFATLDCLWRWLEGPRARRL